MTEMLHDNHRWHLQDGVARVTLTRSDAGNALRPRGVRGGQEQATRIERRGHVRAPRRDHLGRGRDLSRRGDRREFAAEGRAAHVNQVADPLHDAITLSTGAKAPVISVVHAAAAGAETRLGFLARRVPPFTRAAPSPSP